LRIEILLAERKRLLDAQPPVDAHRARDSRCSVGGLICTVLNWSDRERGLLRDEGGYRIAVAGVGLALIAFAISAGVTFATGHQPTSEFWTIASGLSGALVGILAPTPSAAKAGPAGAHVVQAHEEAAAAASQRAAVSRTEAEQAAAQNNSAAAAAASREADLAAQIADTHAKAAKPGRPFSLSVGVLLVIAAGCYAMVLFFHPEHLTPALSKQLQTFAAAALGGAIGMLVPSPAGK
jgi:hypothetical protein